jgi:Big-like domain-containing protein
MRRLSVLICLLAASAATSAAHAATPGVNIARIPTTADLDDAAALGARYVRVFVSQPFGNDPSWRATLRGVTAGAIARGMRPVYVLTGDARGGIVPPPPAEFARFAGGFAREMAKAGGAAAYEVWNEEDSAEFWAGGADAKRYTALLKAAHRAIKAGDRHAKVLLGPLTGNNYAFLSRVYAHGGRDSFDGVGVHTDTACLVNPPSVFYRENGVVGRYTFLGIRSVHHVMAAHGDARKPIWMTELGWTTTTSICARGVWAGLKPSGVGEAAQAANLREAYHCLAGYPWMAAGLWYTLSDATGFGDELDHYGLERLDGSRKPSWDAFHSVAGQGDTLTGPCGDFSGPVLTIRSPTAGARFVAPLHISAVATDAAGVRKFTFLADGRRIRGFGGADVASGKVVSMDWIGSRSLSYGRHRITVVAADPAGNATSRSVVVTALNPLKVRKTLRTRMRLGAVAVDPTGVATVAGRVVKHSPSGLGGRVRVLWQRRRGRRWRTVRNELALARRPFASRQPVAGGATWRVVARYGGVAPFKGSRAATKPFAAP